MARVTIDYQIGYDHGFKEGRLVVLEEIVKLYNSTDKPNPIIDKNASLSGKVPAKQKDSNHSEEVCSDDICAYCTVGCNGLHDGTCGSSFPQFKGRKLQQCKGSLVFAARKVIDKYHNDSRLALSWAIEEMEDEL